jgi:hypothetical protein
MENVKIEFAALSGVCAPEDAGDLLVQMGKDAKTNMPNKRLVSVRHSTCFIPTTGEVLITMIAEFTANS